MRLLSALPLVFLLAACGASSTAQDAGVARDMSDCPDLIGAPTGDALLGLGQMCTWAGQCASGVCAPYKMGAYHLCSLQCTANMSAPQCTSPGDGQCNGMGYCRFPGM